MSEIKVIEDRITSSTGESVITQTSDEININTGIGDIDDGDISIGSKAGEFAYHESQLDRIEKKVDRLLEEINRIDNEINLKIDKTDILDTVTNALNARER